MALIDELNRMSEFMRARKDDMFIQAIYGGRSIMDRLPARKPDYRRNPIYGGLEVRRNDMFPYEQQCSKCSGTGDGAESTFCPSCKGAGRYRVEGVAVGANDSMCVIMHYYPSKPVRWPDSVKVPKRASQGIRSVPWP